MKNLSLLILTLICTVNAMAQPWIVPGTGNIYYNGGNVGIGTSAPQANADISTGGYMLLPNTSGSTNTAILRIGYADHSWAGGQLDMGIYNGGTYTYPAWIQARNPANYSINRNLLLNPNGGNIGIGTAEPQARLSIANSTAGSQRLLYFGEPAYPDGSGSNAYGLSFYGNSADGVFKFYGMNAGIETTNPILAMNRASGNVGIGTTLSINGAMNIVGETGLPATVAGIGIGLVFSGYNATGTVIGRTYIGDGTGYSYLLSKRTGGVTTDLVTFNDNGNVGIGILTPSNKLEVNGTIRAKEIKVESGWADYVFDQGYNLQDLSEVELYINKHKHLPDVPDSKEVEKSGVNLGEMNALLLKKIEELTLYAIEQNKKIETLEKTVNYLISK